jgi:hypothetical protein
MDAHNVCADSHYSDKCSMDPNPHQSDKSNPDSRQCEKTDPDPHKMMRICGVEGGLQRTYELVRLNQKAA